MDKMATDQPSASWVPVPAGSDFPIQNIPFGVGHTAGGAPRPLTAIGEHVVDLSALAEAGLFPAEYADAFKRTALNDFMGAGRKAWRSARATLQALLAEPSWPGANPALRTNEALQAKALLPAAAITMDLPCTIGDYTDFYSSKDHASNVGIMFRGPANALQPNWLWLPVGYHGRSSSVVVSGTAFKRPCGQLAAGPAAATYGVCKELDFELEMGCFIGPGSRLGEPIRIEEADDHIFGFCLLNDWSARDIQRWEYVPLGPFGAKNFCTTISPWIVTLDALAPFKCATSTGAQDPAPLPYLRDPDYGSYDVQLTVAIQGADMPSPAVVSRSNYKHMYWNARQQLVHHTVTGCNMRPGDLLGSGTISGPTPDSRGSMLELAWKGETPVKLSAEGVEATATRVFLLDGDTVTMSGHCEKEGVRIGFGQCVGTVLPASPFVPAAADAGAAST